MNILRRSRKRVNKISFKKYLILVFLFIMTAFAWITYSRILNPNMKLHINSWNIECYVDTNKNMVAEHTDGGYSEKDDDGTVNVSVLNLYPGMDEDITDVIIKNNGEVSTLIDYDIDNIFILGNAHTFTADPSATGNYVFENTATSDDGIKTYEFIKQDTKYPFQIKLESSTEIKGGAEGYIKIRIVWPLEDDTDSNVMDTKWGNDIATYTGNANKLFSFNLAVEAIGTDESSRDLFVSKVKPENYGQPVKYGVDLNGNGNLTDDWVIFCEHRNNVYLIAKDYVKNTKITNNPEISKATGTYGTYGAYWSSESKLLTTTIDSKIRNRYMLTQITDTAEVSLRATANLLKPDYWKNFKDESSGGYADYAVGAPTLEMFIKSWNQKFINNASIQTLKYKWNNAEKGYEFSKERSANYLKSLDLSSYIGTADTELYFPYDTNVMSDGTQCNGYMLASQFASYVENTCYVRYNGIGPIGITYSSKCVRPVVCLKDTVVATQNESGVWILGEEEYTDTVYDKDGNIILPENVVE